METEDRLSLAFLKSHPDDAALLLERVAPAEVAALLEEASAEAAAGVLQRMLPGHGGACLARLPAGRAGEILSLLPADAAAALLRPLEPETRQAMLAHAAADASVAVAALLRYPEGSAGALADPNALALPEDVTAAEARVRVRRSAQQALYYVYVVDRERRLAGVLNLRELMLAPARERLAAVMRTHVASLHVAADRATIAAHPAWRAYHALPVVDDDGKLVGVIRYRTLRAIEQQLAAPRPPAQPLALALAVGELYWLATAGLLRTLARPRRRIAAEDAAEGPPEKPVEGRTDA